MASDDKKEKKDKFSFGKLGALFRKKEDDPIFVEHKSNFKEHRGKALRFHQIMEKYEDCLKDLVKTQEQLHDVIADTYQSDWAAASEYKDYLRAADDEWKTYSLNISKLLEEQRNYLGKFDQMKKKIDLRRKRRDEFDNARSELESRQSAKKRDEVKLAQAQTEFNRCKTDFEKLNQELLSDLPDFCDSRVDFYRKNVGLFARSEHDLFTELAKQLTKAVKFFFYEVSGGVVATPAAPPISSRRTSDSQNPFSSSSESSSAPLYPPVPGSGHPANSSLKESPVIARPRVSSGSMQSSRTTGSTPTEQRKSAVLSATVYGDTSGRPTVIERAPPAPALPPPTKPPRVVEKSNKAATEKSGVVSSKKPEAAESAGNPFLDDEAAVEETPQEKTNQNDDSEKRILEVQETADLAANNFSDSIIRKVRATHTYLSNEEDDELTFEKGDIIEVLPWLSADQEEDGWLRGRTSDGKIGLFPENHTKPL